MNMSYCNPVRLCVLTITFYLLGLSLIFGECQINCASSLEISLDQTGITLVTPNLFLIDSENCTGQKEVLITNENGQLVTDNTLNCTHIGQTLVVEITDIDAEASCWSYLTVVDNAPPKINNCIDHTFYCNHTIPTSEIGNPTFEDNCSSDPNYYFVDEINEQHCDPTFSKIITRTWFVTDTYGNEATPCIQHIYFEPIALTDIDLPMDITIENCNNPNTTPTFTGFPNYEGTTVDNLACQIEVNYTDASTPLCGNTFKIFRSWSIYDWCSNSEISHNQTIKIVDIEPPTINCNGDTLVYFTTDQHECFADVDLIELDITDNCNNFSLTYDWEFEFQRTQVPLGVFPITVTAVDHCNNQSTCDFYIQVIDQQEPIAICESDLQVSLDEFGSYTLDATFLNASSTDNCGISEYLVSNGQGFFHNIVLGCDQLGTPITVSLMVLDESGNSSICSAQITLFDKVAPNIACPADVTIKCYEDPNDLTLTGNATSTDNCEQYTPTFSDDPDLNICNAGIITRTFSVFENEIEITCLQNITLEIDTPSVVFPLDITVECGQSNNLEIVGQPIITAMCPGFLVDKNDEVETDSSCNLITTRVWKVIDNCLDTIFKSEQIITEIDTLPPELIQPASSVILDCMEGDLDSLNNWLSNNGGAIAVDNCTEVTWTNNFDSFDFLCANTGSTSVTFTAEDICGNSISTNANFIIIDTIGPSFNVFPSDMVLQCDTDVQALIDNYLLTNGGAIITDRCSEVQVTSELISNFESLCSSFEVLTTAVDECGLSISATSVITIVDDTPPMIETPPIDIEVSCESGNIEDQIETWIANNGGAIASDLCGTITWENDFNASLSECGVPIEVTFTVTDECDNSSSVTASYTVVDNFAPIIIEPAIDVTFECDGFGNEVDINDFLDNNGFATATDVCSNIVWSNDFVKIDSICGGTGTALVTFTATDICGNESTTAGQITIVDTTPPNVIIPVEEFVVECDGFGNIFEFNTWVQANGNIAVEDICSEVEFTFDFNSLVRSCANAGNVFTVFVASDECNNKTNLITNFIIEDTTPPTVNCPADLTVVDEDTDCNEFIILPPTTAIDLCNGILFFSYEIDFDSDGNLDIVDDGPNASGDYPVGIHTINYYVEDECGNIGVCQQIIEVQDANGSDIDCVETFLLGVDETGVATLFPEDIASISNCLNITTSLSQSNFTCDDCGMNEITLTLTDTDGNITTCTSNVFVCDLANNCENCTPCTGLAVGGTIATENNTMIPEIHVEVQGTNIEIQTNENGAYYFEGVANSSYSIAPYKNDDASNGVTTLDLIAIQRHILGLSLLTSPYQKIAADANNSGSVTTLDIVDIQRVILEVSDEFTNNTSWRFIEKDFVFDDPNNPFTSSFPEMISINGLTSQELNNDFVGVKIGDVNSSYAASPVNSDNRNNTTIPILIDDKTVDKNEVVAIPLRINEMINLEGYQFTLVFDPTLFEFVNLNNFGLENMTIDNFGLSKIDEGILLVNWVASKVEILNEGDNLFSIQLKAKSATTIRDHIGILNEPLQNEVYVQNEINSIDLHQFELQFSSIAEEDSNNETILFQNAPNPFSDATLIKFYLPQESFIELRIHDALGHEIWSLQSLFPAGENEVMIQGNELKKEGIYLCTLNTAFGKQTIKLIHIDKP